MKKLAYLLFLSVIGIIGYTSCENEAINSSIPNLDESPLITTLQQLNDSLSKGRNTRGKRWDRFKKIVHADFAGFRSGYNSTYEDLAKEAKEQGYEELKGDLACGFLAECLEGGVAQGSHDSKKTREATKDGGCTFTVSYEEYSIIFTQKDNNHIGLNHNNRIDFSDALVKSHYDNPSDFILADDSIQERIWINEELLQRTSLNDSILEIGRRHNKTLGLIDSRLECPIRTPNKRYVKGLETPLPSDDELEIEERIIYSQEFIDSFDRHINNPNDYKCNIKAVDKALDLFEEAFYAYPNNEYELADLIKYYTETIKRSNEIPEMYKTGIFATFATALYSYMYWLPEIDEIEE